MDSRYKEVWPGIIAEIKKYKIFLLIGLSIPPISIVIEKGTERKSKFKYLSIEIQRMWNKKCLVITVINGAMVTATKGKKLFGNNTREAFNCYSTKNSFTRNTAKVLQSLT
jgi:hypothetical protein